MEREYKSANRGIFAMAAVAAPLGVGGYLSAREMYRAARANGGKLYSFASRGTQIFASTPINPTSAQMQAMAEHPGATMSEIQKLARSYYSGAKTSKPFDWNRHIGSAAKNLEEMLGNESKRSLLSNAVYNAHLKSLSTAQAADFNFSTGPEMLGETDLATLFHGPQLKNHRLYNEKFARKISSNFSKALKTIDTGMPAEFNNIGKASKIEHRGMWDEGGPAWERLLAERPAVANEIKGSFGQYSKVSLISEDVVSGQIGRLLGVSFTKGKGKKAKTLLVPIIGPGGEVRMGTRFSTRGAGRNIFNQNESLPADVFLARNINRPWTPEFLKTIKNEKERAFTFGRHDPLDEFTQGANTLGLASDEIALRSQQHVPTLLDQFDDGKGNRVALADLSPERRVALKEHLLEHHGFRKLSSEGSFNKEVWDTASTEMLHFGGVTDPNKQMAEYRSLSKGIRLVADPLAKQTASKAPLITTAAEEIFGHGNANPVGAHIGGITPLAATLFGDLPSSIEELEHADVAARFKNHLAKNVEHIDAINAERIWGRTKRMLSHGNNLEAARNLGRLGEGGFLVQNGFGGHVLETVSSYKIDKLHLNDYQQSHLKNNHFEKTLLLGHDSSGQAITARGNRNYIDSISPNRKGYIVSVREHYDVTSGAKLDAAGIKGLAVGIGAPNDSKPMQDTKAVLNHFYGLTAKPGEVVNRIGSDVNMLALTNFNHDKADPFQLVMGAATDTAARLEGLLAQHAIPRIAAGHASLNADQIRESLASQEAMARIADKFKSGLAEHNIRFVGNQIIEDHKAVAAMSASARRTRISGLTKLAEDLMTATGQHIRDHGGYNDPLFKNFRRGISKTMAGKDLAGDAFLNFSIRNGANVGVYGWNTSQLNMPKQTKLTFDMEGSLFGNDYHAALQDLKSNTIYPQGDPTQARAMASYLAKGDFSKPLGQIHEADSEIHAIGSARGRASTMFDPDNPLASDNWSMSLGEGKGYLPVLGHEAFGGKAGSYGSSGAFSTTELEKHLRGIINNGPTDERVAAYHAELKSTLYGKNGFFRADAVHTKAASPFIYASPSSLTNADGSRNPFEISIGPDTAKSMGATDGQFAMFTRHPVSTTPFVKIKIDDRIKGSNLVGVDIDLHSSLHADVDGDIGNIFLLNRSGEAGVLSAAEQQAHNSIFDVNSIQNRYLRLSRAMQGVGDDTRRITEGPGKSMAERVQKLMDQAMDIKSIYKKRTTGQAIGRFSNLMTRMSMQLESHPGFIGNHDEKNMLNLIFWQTTRQAAIAAQKKAGGFNIEQAMEFTSKLSNNLNKRNGIALHASLLDLTRKLEEPTGWIPEMGDIGIAGKPGDMLQPMHTWLTQNKSTVEKFGNTLDHNVDAVYKMITASKDSMADGKVFPTFEAAHNAMGDLMPYLQGATGGPAPHVSTIADHVAEVLGAENDFTSRARSGFKAASEKYQEVASAFKADVNLSRASKYIGVAVGIAAIAGIATARPSFDNRRSSNSLRPEEVAGVQDHIPTEPVAGSRSPSQQPRMVHNAPAEPRTTYVTPVQSAVNIDVQTRGEDRQTGIEKLKLASQMAVPGNNSHGNYTVINRDLTRMGSLRFKSKMRDALGN